MRQVAPRGTVNPPSSSATTHHHHLLLLFYRPCRALPLPLSLPPPLSPAPFSSCSLLPPPLFLCLPYRSFCLAISRPHATLVTNLNCSTSKVNALIPPAGRRRGEAPRLGAASCEATRRDARGILQRRLCRFDLLAAAQWSETL